MNFWGLPTSAHFGGRDYLVNADYRDILEIISVLQSPEEPDYVKAYVALDLFYDGFRFMPEEYHQAASDWMLDFLNCGEPEEPGAPRHKTIDWEQDRGVIAAEVNKVAGTEIRALPFLHWWTFIAYFNGIGDGQLALIVSIREKLRKGKKLEEYERNFYRANRTRVDFKQKFTHADDEVFVRWGVK